MKIWIIKRNRIKEIAKKTKFSEIYIARKMLELAKNAENEQILINSNNTNVLEDCLNKEKVNKKKHIGYYLDRKRTSRTLQKPWN